MDKGLASDIQLFIIGNGIDLAHHLETKVVHLSRQKIRCSLMNLMLLYSQLTMLDNTSQPVCDIGWKNAFVQNCKCGYSA